MNEQTALQINSPQTGAVEIRPQQTPTVGAMLAAVIERGVSGESVAVVEALTKLMREERAEDAKRSFIRAFVALQGEMTAIKAIHPVMTKENVLKYRVAHFDEIDEQVRPLCMKYGFSYTFDTAVDGPRQVATFTLMHKDGHCKEAKYAVRIGSGPPGATESQADGSAISYAKRGAMCACLSIMIDRDDPRMEGDGEFVTPEVAFELERRVAETNSDKARFLKFAGAATFAEIKANRYDALDELLRRKEGGK